MTKTGAEYMVRNNRMAVFVFRHHSAGWRRQRSEVWWPCFRHCAAKCRAHGWVSKTTKVCLCFTMPPWTTGLSSLRCCSYSPWMSMCVATTSCLLVSGVIIMMCIRRFRLSLSCGGCKGLGSCFVTALWKSLALWASWQAQYWRAQTLSSLVRWRIRALARWRW